MTDSKQLIKIFEEQAVYYNIMKNNDNLANADLACFIDECLKLDDFSKNLPEEEVQRGAAILFKADEAISIMMNLLEDWQNIDTCSNPQHTMLSRWFAILTTSMYLHYMIVWLHNESLEYNKFSSLYEARDFFDNVAEKCGLDYNQRDTLFQNIESRLGYNGPLKLKPMPESPGQIFGLALKLQELKDKLFQNKMLINNLQ